MQQVQAVGAPRNHGRCSGLGFRCPEAILLLHGLPGEGLALGTQRGLRLGRWAPQNKREVPSVKDVFRGKDRRISEKKYGYHVSAKSSGSFAHISEHVRILYF